jgi:hypothetical protein
MDSDENSLTGCAAANRMLVMMAPVTPIVRSLLLGSSMSPSNMVTEISDSTT